jgi:hypothetical protein
MVSLTYQRDGLLDNILEKNRRIDFAKDLLTGMVDAEVIKPDLADVLFMALEGGEPFPAEYATLVEQPKSDSPATTVVTTG